MKIIIFLVARLVEFLQCLLVKIMRVFICLPHSAWAAETMAEQFDDKTYGAQVPA